MLKLFNLFLSGDIDFPRKQWAKSRKLVDGVMDMVLERLRSESFEGIRIDSYIRQGSSREGLKVVEPDEFDAMLEFHIEGLEGKINQESILDQDNRHVSGFCFMKIDGVDMAYLRKRYPRLVERGLFVEQGGRILLSSKSLYERFFKSLVDKATDTIRESNMYKNLVITRKDNPPAVNVQIRNNGFDPTLPSVIDIDFVPAFRLRVDETTTYEGTPLNCPIHAVCKWSPPESFKALEFVDSEIVWNVKTTGYEIHILDVARNDTRKSIILTALRIVKTYFTKTKHSSNSPPPLVKIVKTYHLKQIAFYILYYLCHVHRNYELKGVERALLYFIDFLEVALETKRLPHFFFSEKAAEMLPGYPAMPPRRLHYNQFRRIPNEALDQAKHSLMNHMVTDFGFGPGANDTQRDSVKQKFRSFATSRDYF